MRSGSFYRTPEWKLGDEGQRLVAELLRRKGYWVVPSYDFSGTDGDKAPKMIGPGPSLVLPDLDVARDGMRMWVEVKTKRNGPTLHNNTNTWEHGFSRRHFDHYRQVQVITGNRVFVIFYEANTGRMVGHWLSRLAKLKRDSMSRRMGAMVFFPLSELMEVGDMIPSAGKQTPDSGGPA